MPSPADGDRRIVAFRLVDQPLQLVERPRPLNGPNHRRIQLRLHVVDFDGRFVAPRQAACGEESGRAGRCFQELAS